MSGYFFLNRIIDNAAVSVASALRRPVSSARAMAQARPVTDRGAESAEQIARRLEVARAELAAQGEFQHRIVNADREQATDELIRLAATMCVPEARNAP